MARTFTTAAQRTTVRFGLSEDLAIGAGLTRSAASDWRSDLLDLVSPSSGATWDLAFTGRTASRAPDPAPAAVDPFDIGTPLALTTTTDFDSLALRCGCAYCMKSADAFPADGVGERPGPFEPQPLLVTTDLQPDDISTTSELTVDGPHIVSTLDTVGDQDFFRVELEAGQYYDIGVYLTTLGPSGVPLADAYIELYDQNGELVVSADGGGPNTPSGLDALLTYQAEYSGTYYINARAYDMDSTNGTTGDFVGDYEIFVDSIDPGAAGVYTPFYSPDSPLHSLDWGSQVDRTVRNPDGDNGTRDNGVPNTGTIRHAQYDIEGKNVITYYFAKQGDVFVDEDPTNPGLATIVAQGMQQWEKDAFRTAFDLYEQVADLLYVEVDNRWEADFKIITYEGTPGVGASLLGRMSPPNEPNEGQTEINSGDARWTEEGVQQGGFYFPTLLHELGHGHGLAHPHDNGGRSSIMRGSEGGLIGGSLADFDLSQQVFTIMSYNDGWQTSPYGMPRSGGITGTQVDHYGWVGTLAALDIAVIQDKYGVNEEWATGDDVYHMDDENGPGSFYSTIWDAGGTDEIRYEGQRDTTIDLRAATLRYEEGGGGRVSFAYGVHAGFTIANGVTIENATTGSGDDTLIGNEAANTLIAGHGVDQLNGEGGDDVLEGGGGADVLRGGGGIDTLSYAGSTARVVVRLWNETSSGGHANGDDFSEFENVTGGAFNDSLIGDAGANVLAGLAGDDYLDGLAGDDTIIGGLGADRLLGGDGVDTLSYAGSNARVVVRLWNETSSGGHANGDEFSGFENVTGGAFNDSLIGDAGANVLAGLAGDDYLDGLAGDDTILGGQGADRLLGGGGVDTLSYAGSAGGVTVRLWNHTASGGDATGDSISGFENLIGSGANDTLIGSAAANRIEGGASADYLDGMDGDDFLVGGAGNDRMRGGAGADLFDFVGGSGADQIYDFEAGAAGGDVLRLDSAVFADFADVLAHTTDNGSGSAVISKGDLSITLHGVEKAQLLAADFAFAGAATATTSAPVAETGMPSAPPEKDSDTIWAPSEPRVAEEPVKIAPDWAAAREPMEFSPALMDGLDAPRGFSRHEPETPWDWLF